MDAAFAHILGVGLLVGGLGIWKMGDLGVVSKSLAVILIVFFFAFPYFLSFDAMWNRPADRREFIN